MLQPPFSFDDVMAPIGAERFMAEFDGKKPLHLKGDPDKFKAVMDWSGLNDLLSQATIWSHQSLMLVLDKEPVPMAAYCGPAAGRDGGQVMRPDPAKVQSYLQKGATLVANDIDHLSTTLTAFSKTLEDKLGGKVQGNLYCSSKRRPGFAAHFDTHDVYAVHVEGTKTWKVYEGRATDPIAHPMFKTLGREHHEKAKGDLLMTVEMEPGDLLYLPRGQYHDALADDGGAVHIAFGVTYPIGMDVMSFLFEEMIKEPAFRANLPKLAENQDLLAARIAMLGDKIKAVLAEPRTVKQVRSMQERFCYPRAHYDVPELLSRPSEERFVVNSQGIRLIEQNGRFGLVREGSRHAIEVPTDVSAMTAWVLDRQQFSKQELASKFPERPPETLEKFLKDMANMRLVGAA